MQVMALPEGISALLSNSQTTSGIGVWLMVIAALLLAIGSWIFALVSYNKKSWKEYEYKRSEYTTTRRFKREIKYIEELSGQLLELVKIFEECEKRGEAPVENPVFVESMERAWRTLGGSAPFLRYMELEKGSSYCGVRCDPCDRESGGSGTTKGSLYQKGYDLLDAMSERGSHVPKSGSARKLMKRYDAFATCAYCRLCNVEAGTKDARRNRKKDLKRDGEYLGPDQCLDPRCCHAVSSGRSNGE